MGTYILLIVLFSGKHIEIQYPNAKLCEFEVVKQIASSEYKHIKTLECINQ